MKTTIDISESVLRAAKALAAERRTTLRALVEAGLRRIVDEHDQATGFRLHDASFRGRGLQPAFRERDWQDVLAAAYEGRGG